MIKLVDFVWWIFYHSKKKQLIKKKRRKHLYSAMKKQMELASDGVW